MIVSPDHRVNGTNVTVEIAPAAGGNAKKQTKKKQDVEDEWKISFLRPVLILTPPSRTEISHWR